MISVPAPPQADYRLVESPEQLSQLINDVEARMAAGEPRRASIDTEADSFHCYKEKLCLLQFTAAGIYAIIDPLKVEDQAVLLDFLDTCELWLHGADYDISMMQRTYGRVHPQILDTQIAAQLAGFRKFGLSPLVEQIFDVVLSKESQRADWAQRPIPQEMLDYAINDVLYLIPMADGLLARLRELGREDWFYQSCAAAQDNAFNRPAKDPDDLWRIKGWGKLKPRGWGYLRAVWLWRDGEAERLDRPAFKTMPNGKLLYLAERMEKSGPTKLSGRYDDGQKQRFDEAVEEASKVADEDLPKRRRLGGRERIPDLDERVAPLKAFRDQISEDLDIEPTLIATRSDLEEFTLHPECLEERFLPWQQELLRPWLDQVKSEA